MTTYHLTRDIPVEDDYDIVIAGGGPAGSAAAISAGRLGAKVLLVESTGCLGGMGTSGLVNWFDSMANGKRNLVGGVMREIVETLYARRQLGPDVTPDHWRLWNPAWTEFQPEGLKLLLDELTVQAGVEVRFFTRVIDADADAKTGRVNGVILNNIEGYRYVQAKMFIDCTGDAVLADLCGAACREAGRDAPRPMPPTLCSSHTNVDWDRVKAAAGQKHHMEMLLGLMPKAIAEGHFTIPDKFGMVAFARLGQNIFALNGGHVFDLNALRCRSLSDGMMLGRRLAQEYLSFFRKCVPGCENMELVTTASLMGIRESRRIVGEFELTFADFLARRQFPDQIGVYSKPVDIHPRDTSETEFQRCLEELTTSGRLSPGECFGIPYSILVPKGWSNLWIAGRCNSSDVQVHGSIRVMPAAAMMGQAVGTAAVQSVHTGQPACDLDTEQLVVTLREHGAYLPQPTLNKTMTR